MSGRMVRRLLKQQGNDLATNGEQKGASGYEEEEEEEEETSRAPAVNPFDLLGDEDGGSGRSDEDEPAGGATEPSDSPTPSISEAGTSGKGKKKKKGKSKGRGKGAGANGSSQSATATSDATLAEQVDSVDQILKDLKVDNWEGAAVTTPLPCLPDDRRNQQASTSESARSAILGVDPRHLKAEDELRRIFGSKVINAVERRGEMEGANMRRRMPPGARRGSGVGGRVSSLRKHLLVQPLDHWPRWDGGISMESTGTKEGFQSFKYVHSASYVAIQKRYEACVASHDPNTLAHLVGQYPFHVDSLLALAEVYKSAGEFQTSAELLERCLYSLECAWHPWFNPTLGTCRLEYKVAENKPLFHALFRHLQHLGRRGCHRTALEICKLLLSLDPEDPLGALFCIDYYALRAEQFDWLERFADQYSADSSLGLFPNFAFSLALARFHLESGERARTDEEKGGEGGPMRRQVAPQGSGGARKEANRRAEAAADRAVTPGSGLVESDHAEAKVSSQELLQQGLMLHPLMLKVLVDKAPIKIDGPWAKILKHRVFAHPPAGGPSLEHLIELYIQRNSVLWRSPEVQAWLREGAAAVLAMADRAGGSRDQGEVASWAVVRREAFPSETNEYRHLFLADFSDSIATLPPEEVAAMQQQAGRVGGGLPRAEMMRAPPVQQGAAPAAAAPPPRQLDPEGQNALLVFLQAMLPWNDYGRDLQGEEGGRQGERAREGEERGERRVGDEGE